MFNFYRSFKTFCNESPFFSGFLMITVLACLFTQPSILVVAGVAAAVCSLLCRFSAAESIPA